MRARFRRCVLHFIQKLMPRKRSLDIKITFVKGLNAKEKMMGSCLAEDSPPSHKHSEFTIQVDADLSFKTSLSILAHELTHVKQYAIGEMSYDYRKVEDTFWKGKRIPASVKYEDQPWEKDARKQELALVEELITTTTIWKK
jgi:hypothetical protein